MSYLNTALVRLSAIVSDDHNQDMVNIEQESNVVGLDNLVKAVRLVRLDANGNLLLQKGPPYDQPEVIPEWAEQHGLVWSPMTARWVTPANRDHHQKQYDERVNDDRQYEDLSPEIGDRVRITGDHSYLDGEYGLVVHRTSSRHRGRGDYIDVIVDGYGKQSMSADDLEVVSKIAKWDMPRSLMDLEPDEHGDFLVPGEGAPWAHVRYTSDYVESEDYQGRSSAAMSTFFSPMYAGFNKKLREGAKLNRDEQQTYMALKEAMEPVSKDYTVYRGWRFNPDAVRLKEGDVYITPQFTSTTADPGYAILWGGYDKRNERHIDENPIWEIQLRKGDKSLRMNPSEAEYTTDSGAPMRCIGVKEGRFKIPNQFTERGYVIAQDLYVMEMIDEDEDVGLPGPRGRG